MGIDCQESLFSKLDQRFFIGSKIIKNIIKMKNFIVDYGELNLEFIIVVFIAV